MLKRFPNDEHVVVGVFNFRHVVLVNEALDVLRSADGDFADIKTFACEAECRDPFADLGDKIQINCFAEGS